MSRQRRSASRQVWKKKKYRDDDDGEEWEIGDCLERAVAFPVAHLIGRVSAPVALARAAFGVLILLVR
eukprot:9495904-Pyramimonas_sp.AAC.1